MTGDGATNKWDEVRSRIESAVSLNTFDTWFRNTRMHSAEGKQLFVIVPNHTIRTVLKRSYKAQIENALRACDVEAVSYYTEAELGLAEEPAPAKPPEENPIVVVSYSELLTLDIPRADPLIDPLLTKAGTIMLYSWAKWGKSWIATEMAFRLAKGVPQIFSRHDGPGGHWPLYGPVRTLYVYGEMHGERIRQRLQLIARHHHTAEDFDALAVVSKDYQRIGRANNAARAWRPSIVTLRDRQSLLQVMRDGGYKLLVLDNISTLWSAAQEDQSHQTAVLKDYFVELNTEGITVLFLQHAGKSGDFLGDSSQVHILDSWLKLEHPGDYRKSQGLRCIVNVEGLRHELLNPHWAAPFEVQLVTSPEGGAEWLTRPAMASLKKTAFEMFGNGAPPIEVLRTLPSVKRPTLYRWRKEWEQKKSSDTNQDDEE